MNWKKIGLFILFFIVGLFLFLGITVFTYLSLFLPIFFIAYIVFLVFILKEYSNKKMMIISIIIVVYVLIMVIPFPKCYSWGYFSQETQDCTCIGVEKYRWLILDAGGSQCVGIPIDYVCHKRNRDTGIDEKVSCN
ncbi:hypothetical protein CL617_03010 [archaeon]|nr:hypothetical protein [archaeon]|tara:strand:- start:13008 stop:13415 length:408 start_codon:yes stop_codon:yes gene_type:complete